MRASKSVYSQGCAGGESGTVTPPVPEVVERSDGNDPVVDKSGEDKIVDDGVDESDENVDGVDESDDGVDESDDDVDENVDEDVVTGSAPSADDDVDENVEEVEDTDDEDTDEDVVSAGDAASVDAAGS